MLVIYGVYTVVSGTGDRTRARVDWSCVVSAVEVPGRRPSTHYSATAACATTFTARAPIGLRRISLSTFSRWRKRTASLSTTWLAGDASAISSVFIMNMESGYSTRFLSHAR